jgi:hypothetical protein
MLQMHITPDAPAAVDWDDHLKHNAADKQRIVQLTP